jgi:putative ABC transport system ATP-binding protein
MTTLAVSNLHIKVGDQNIINNLTFELNSGDWLTITGPSGTGKSTLLKIIAGLTTQDGGHVIVDDMDSLTADIGSYRQAVSYAAQSAQLFGKTVRDNLDLPFMVRGQEPDESKQRDGLTMVQLPAEYLDKDITELSGGERQRVGVLRNLLFPPKVLLLDEITTGLDAETKDDIWEAIAKQHDAEQNIVLSVTHDAEEISAASMTLHLEDGEGVMSHE